MRANYRAKFEKFDNVFGRSNVTLVKFEPTNFPNHCIVEDFCQRTGISFPQEHSITRVNESLTREACGILYAYRKYGSGYGIGPDSIRENHYIIKPLRTMSGSKFKISKSVVDQNFDLEQVDVHWMENRLGSSLAEDYLDTKDSISTEIDLLTVTRASCQEFAEKFSEIWGVDVPNQFIPKEEPIDPVQIAEFIESCRGLGRQLIRDKKAVLAEKQRLRKTFRYRVKRFTCATIRCIKRFFVLWLFL
jgi:hypothetical protein